MSNHPNFKNRVGEIKKNLRGTTMEIIEYNGTLDITVLFENGDIKKCTYNNFKTGSVNSVLDRTVEGVGYIGQGKHIPSEIKKYSTWKNMFTRCYNARTNTEKRSYADSTVCDEWHNFQRFGEWFDKNYYSIGEQQMQLDKDIILKGNKLYSPKHCIFVPSCINKLFTKTNFLRGDLPIGVTVRNSKGTFVSRSCNQLTMKRKYLGDFDTKEEAFYAYKTYKEAHIKEVVDYYKETIPNALYTALYRYEVSITD